MAYQRLLNGRGVRKAMLPYLFTAQDGDCFYCGRPCWMHGESNEAVAKRCGAVSRADKRKRQATCEHLTRLADGGGHDRTNLVMACAECNGARGEKAVLLHLADMRAQHRESA